MAACHDPNLVASSGVNSKRRDNLRQGSSPVAGQVAAKHVDTYLTWGEPPGAVAEKIDWIASLAAAHGRRPRFGIRLHVISRDTSEQAWAARRLLDGLDPETIPRTQAGLARSESEGQNRSTSAAGPRPRWLAATPRSPGNGIERPRRPAKARLLPRCAHLTEFSNSRVAW